MCVSKDLQKKTLSNHRQFPQGISLQERKFTKVGTARYNLSLEINRLRWDGRRSLAARACENPSSSGVYVSVLWLSFTDEYWLRCTGGMGERGG